MVWFRIDDGFHQHPKVLSIPRPLRKQCLGVWTLAGAWVASNVTDGFVPAFYLREIGASDKEIAALTESGLWDVKDDGYLFHDWHECNPSRVQVLAERAAAKERQRKARERANEKRRASRRDSDEADHENVVNATMSRRDGTVSHADVQAESRSPRPDPTRPGPLEEISPGGDISPETALIEVREDVERICKHLADRVEANGSKRPTLNAWARESARRLLDVDGRSEKQVHAAIDWCQDDEFWRANIRSVAKLRQQYDTLRLRASATPPQPRLSPGDAAAALTLQLFGRTHSDDQADEIIVEEEP